MVSVGSMSRLVGRKRTAPVLAVVMVVTVAGGACGRARPRVGPSTADRSCIVRPAPVTPAESATVVVTWPVDAADVLGPGNPGERFAFQLGYETLIRVDCLGRPQPGLAVSWPPLDGRGRWRIVIREGARFWNGDPVTARDVIASWRETGRASAAVLARRAADGSTAADDRTLDIVLADSVPVALGDPELAVVRRSGATRWPEGTGPYRVRDASPPPRGAGPLPSALVLEPVHGVVGQRLTIYSAAASDARDRIDAGADLVLTEDAAIAGYAAGNGLDSLSAGWTRGFALLTPPRTPVGGEPVAGSSAVATRAGDLRATLARDAVRADARAADVPHWLSDAGRCSVQTASLAAPDVRAVPDGGATARVVFPREEPVARALAERLVALAAIGRGGAGDTALALLAPALLQAGARATAAALTRDDFRTALAAGRELAYVIPVPRRSLAPCSEIERLAARAPWFRADPTRADLSSAVLSAAVVPLVDTRLHAVVRRDRLGLTMAWDSTVTVSPFASSGAGVVR